MLKNIEPGVQHAQTGIKTQSPNSLESFSSVMSAFGPAGVEATAQASGANTATLTSAVVTGVTGAAAGSNVYGMRTASPTVGDSPFLPGGYSVPSTVGYGTGTGTGYTGGSDAPLGYGGSSVPTDPFLQQDYLLNKMRDTNLQMIGIQAEVQQINREFTTISNVMKAKHDTQIGTIRNFRVA